MTTPPDFPWLSQAIARRVGGAMTMLRWSFEPTAYPMEDLAIIVFRAPGPNGPWQQLSVVPEGTTVWTDTNSPNAGLDREYYYRVRLTSKTGQGYRDTEAFSCEFDQDRVARVMVRNRMTTMRCRSGTGVLLLLRKRWGAKCPACWNAERRGAGNAQCPVCYGTNYEGGFLAPIWIPVGSESPQFRRKRGSVAEAEQDNGIEAGPDPVITDGDVIVYPVSGERYYVENVKNTAHRMSSVMQRIYLTYLPEGHIIYRIAVPLSYNDLSGRSFDLLDLWQPQNKKI